MRIGILTYHRAYNYGAVLQCYALKEVLKRMGHDVYVIDYRQPNIEKFYHFKSCASQIKAVYERSILKGIIFCLLSPLLDIKNFYLYLRRKSIFETFQRDHLNLTEKCDNRIPQDFDRYIIGSDMLWSYDTETNDFDNVYLGEFAHKEESKIIGYAISGTPDSFHRLGLERKYEFLKNFERFSIRERALADIVNTYIKAKVDCCIDPTLLATKDLWNNILNQKWLNQRYLLTYYLRIPGEVRKRLDNKIETLAKDNKLVVININKLFSSLTVADFVSIISCAQYIVTDSFHGVVFSLIYERPFHALKLNDSHDARYVDILNTIGAEELAVDAGFTPMIPQINYEELNKNIEVFRQDSKDFLMNSLS
jgi:hypothetical protein